MASELSAGRPQLARLKSTATGAISLNATFVFDPQGDADYRAWLGTGFEAVQVVSPIAAAGAADLRISVGSSIYDLAGGGNTLTIPGPVASMRITALNVAVAGTGSDDVRITPLARYKAGAM